MVIVNSAAMNIWVRGYFKIMFFLGYMPRNGIAGSCGNSIFIFLKNPLPGASTMSPARGKGHEVKGPDRQR